MTKSSLLHPPLFLHLVPGVQGLDEDVLQMVAAVISSAVFDAPEGFHASVSTGVRSYFPEYDHI